MGRQYGFVLALVLAGCGEVKQPGDSTPCEPGTALSCDGDDLLVCSDSETPERTACAHGCQSDALACKCDPSAATCANGSEEVCGADGLLVKRACSLGCFDQTRCADIAPTNQLAQFLDDSETGPEIVLNAGDSINTTNGTYTLEGLIQTIPTFLLQAPQDGVQVRVFPLRSFRVTGAITVTGFPALAIVSDGDIKIEGVIRALAGAGPDGRGGGGGFFKCSDNPAMARIGGQGGGGFGQPGGVGGTAITAPIAEGGTAGAAVGNRDIVPLRGGGTNASVTGAGGGIQLVSRTRIDVINGGAINAGGQGGSDNGGGGGAGGGIVLEAPTVVVANGGTLAANGGGGGCGVGTVITSAEGGRLDTQRAAGCQSADSRDGGAGGAGDGAAGVGLPGGDIAGCGVSAGTGGGGVGRIRISTASGTFGPGAGGLVTPTANVLQLGTR